MVRVSKRNGRAMVSLIWETVFPRIEIATADVSTVRRGSLHGKEQSFRERKLDQLFATKCGHEANKLPPTILSFRSSASYAVVTV